MLNIALIDKHPIFRKGVSLILTKYNSDIVIHEYSEFKEYYKSQFVKTDLVILGINGESDFREIKSNKSLLKHLEKFKVIVYETEDINDHLVELLSLGIRGYLKKTCPVQEFLTCVTTVISGSKYVNNQDLINHFHQTYKMEVKVDNGILTRRQREVANFLIQGRKTSEISEVLDIKSSTVSTLKAQVYNKLGVSNVIELKRWFEKDTLKEPHLNQS